MNLYEAVFIVKYNYINNEYNPQDLLTLLQAIGKDNIKIANHEYWGLLDFAYPIKRKKKGYYVMVNFEMETTQLERFKKKLVMNDNIIRFMILKIKQIPTKQSQLAKTYLEKQQELAS